LIVELERVASSDASSEEDNAVRLKPDARLGEVPGHDRLVDLTDPCVGQIIPSERNEVDVEVGGYDAPIKSESISIEAFDSSLISLPSVGCPYDRVSGTDSWTG